MYHSLVYVVFSVNVTPGVKEDRMMITGMHTVSDIFCVGCGSIVGWKYVRFVKVICSLVCIDWHLNFMNLFSRKPHMRRTRGTRKESIFWRGMTNIFCHSFFCLCLILFILYIQMTWLMVCKCLSVLVMPKAAFDFIVSLEFTGINFYCEQVQGGRPRRKPVLDCTWSSFGRKWCRRYMKRDWASSSMFGHPL